MSLKQLGLWNDPSFGGLCHVIAGIITVVSYEICFILPIILYLGFRDYELNEEYHIRDMAFKDIQEYIIGLFVGVCLMIIVRW